MKNNQSKRTDKKKDKIIPEEIHFPEKDNLFFRELIESAVIGVAVVTLEGTILYTNAEMQRLLGYNPNELKGKNIEVIFLEHDRGSFFSDYEKSISVKNPRIYIQDKRFLRKDGDLFHGNLNISTVREKSTGISYYLVQIQKFSGSKITEKSIIDDFKLLIQLTDNIPANLYIKDEKSRFIFANKRVANTMGAKNPYNLIGKTDFDYYPEHMARKFYNDEQEIMTTGMPKINIEEKVMEDEPGRKRIRWYSTSKLPYYDSSGKRVGIMGIGLDITELKKEQESLRKAKRIAVKADQLKTAFLTNFSHEIRTPLNGILGFSQVMKHKNISASQIDQYLNIILDSGKQLLNLINDILDLSKIDTKDLLLSCQNFSLDQLFLQLHEEFKAELEKKHKQHIGLGIKLNASQEESYINADSFRLRQIMTNLLTNAIKFTENGEITFGYSFDGNILKCFVSDTGIGIPDNKQSTVFERFVQVDGSHTRMYSGAGLGLSISKGLVELMNGKIWLESVIDKGTTFYFSIPCTKAFGDAPDQKHNS